MSLKAKLFISFSVSLVLVAGLCFIFLGHRDRAGTWRPERAPGADPETLSSASAGEEEKAVEAAPVESGETPAVDAGGGESAAVAKADPSAPGWLILGRMVREDAAGILQPAPGVTIHVRGHPRKTKPEDAPPPRKLVTGPDGRFEFPGVPPRISMRLEVDEPSSAYRALSFKLGSTEGDDKKDLGDIPLDPGSTLQVELLGPNDEAVEKATVLVEKSSSNHSPLLANLGFSDSRREAEEKGKGKYVLERAPPGSLNIDVQAPRCASTREKVELPRAEPVIIRLAAGHRIAGLVFSAGTAPSSEKTPLRKADVEVTSGPDLFDPRPKEKTDGSGRFTFDSLSDGSFEVVASAEGYASERKRDVSSGTEDLEFTLVPEAIITGKVVSGGDDRPVPKAKVSLQGLQGESYTADTDSEGLFSVRKILPGTYTMTAEHADYAQGLEETRELKSGEKLEDQVIRLSSGVTALGMVLDSETGAGIAGAQVTFQSIPDAGVANQPRARRTAKTGPDGKFEAKGLVEGRWKLAAKAKGYLDGKDQTIAVAPEGSKDLSVALELGASISGKVIDSSGKAVAGASVRPRLAMLSPEDWNEGLWRLQNVNVQSDAEGRYVLDGLPAHKGYSLAATHIQFASGSVKDIDLGAREAVEGIDITLMPGGTIRGRVLDAEGAGVAGARVGAEEAGAEEERRSGLVIDNRQNPSTVTDAEGGYKLSNLRAGKYQVKAQAKERSTARRSDVEVQESETTEGVDLVLGVGETLSGRVADADGNPIAGVRVRAWTDEQAEGRSDAEGRFQILGLKAGSVSIQVEKTGFNELQLQVTVPGEALTLTLDRLAKILGKVRAQDLTKLSGLRVGAILQGEEGQQLGGQFRNGRPFGEASRTDPSGGFEIEVPKGTYVLQATASGFAPGKSTKVTVEAGETLDGVVIDLPIGGTVQGTVVTRGTGVPVAGASVYRSSNRFEDSWGVSGANSGSDGVFTLEGLPEGSLDLAASHSKYAQTILKGVNIRPGETTMVQIELSAGGGIRGSVIRGGAPVRGAQVYVSATDGKSGGKQAMTDAEGRFEIQGLTPGEYNAFVNMPGSGGGLNERQSVTIYDGQTSQLDIVLGRTIRLYGRVTSGGMPLTDGRIDAMQIESKGRNSSGSIDASGNYSIDLPGTGKYYLFVGRGQRGGSKLEVVVPEGAGDMRHDIELPAGEISGVVLDAETGAPIRGAQVMAAPAGSGSRNLTDLLQGMQGMTQSDDLGRFSILSVPPGSYALRAFQEGYVEGRIERIEVGEREGSFDNRIALERGVTLRAKVVDSEGRPVAQAMAFLRDETGNLVSFFRPAVSGQDGTLEIHGVRASVYSITLIHSSYAMFRTTLDVASGGPDPVLAMGPAARLTVQVSSRQGKPVEGAAIELLDEDGQNVLEDLQLSFMTRGSQLPTRTGPDGLIVLDQVAPGKYRLAATMDGGRSREEKVTLLEGRSADARLTMAE